MAVPAEHTPTLIGVVILIVHQVGKTAREVLVDRRTTSRLRALEKSMAEALDHVASINRKEWRRDHPGHETPAPFEPRTMIGETPKGP